VSNYDFGLAAVGNSTPRFEFNTAQQCRLSGIMIQDEASARVNQNLTLRNGQHGIAVLGRAKASVERNETCYNGLRSNEYEKWAAIYVQHEVGRCPFALTEGRLLRSYIAYCTIGLLHSILYDWPLT
jgi:hypothetical protein